MNANNNVHFLLPIRIWCCDIAQTCQGITFLPHPVVTNTHGQLFAAC